MEQKHENWIPVAPGTNLPEPRWEIRGTKDNQFHRVLIAGNGKIYDNSEDHTQKVNAVKPIFGIEQVMGATILLPIYDVSSKKGKIKLFQRRIEPTVSES